MIINKQKAFSLLEVIIYIALFTIMIGSLVVTAFQISQSGGKASSRIAVQEEMNFVLRKLNWALTGASAITNSSGVLKVTNENYTKNKIFFKLTDTTLRMCEKSLLSSCPDSDFQDITSVNVKVSNFTITNPDLKSVTITLIINGQTATISKYLKL